jgi:hypothetical protein
MAPASSPYDQIRQRRVAERPFAGHTTESLERKLASGGLREFIRELVKTELLWRARNELPGRT